MANLTEDEKLKYQGLFQHVSEESGTGELNMEHFEKLLVLCGHRFPKETVVSLFVNTDHDGDRNISLDEFLNFMSDAAPSDSPQSMAASLRRQFSENDSNKDGFISLVELKAVVTDCDFVQAGGLLSPEWLEECMKEWDTDGDGRLDFEEFLTMFIKTQLVESDVDDKKEQDEGVKEFKDILLSADGIRRICIERGLVKDDCVSVEDLRLVLTEVKVQLNDEQLEASINMMDPEGAGRISLEAFVGVFEELTASSFGCEGGEDSEQVQLGQTEEEKKEEETPVSNQEETPVSNQEETPVSNQEETPVSYQEETPVSYQEETPVSYLDEMQGPCLEEPQEPYQEETPAPYQEETSAPYQEEISAPCQQETLKKITASDSDVKQRGAMFETQKRGVPVSAKGGDGGAKHECKNAGVRGLISQLENKKK